MKTKHIFLIGYGNVGKKFVSYVEIYNRTAKKQKLIIAGVVNSKNMVLGQKNIYAKMQNLPKQTKADLNKFINYAKLHNGKNKIIVDCTASEKVADKYPDFAKAGLHIVTANKFFNTKPIAQYKNLRKILVRKNKKFLYTTNVGSGLPIIPTLKSFIQSQDKISKIEGVFSGSLSYLFNSMQEGEKFSSTIKKAIKLGYMEPDPREDLTGRDVARKLVILAREIGIMLETQDIKFQNLVPLALRKLKNSKEIMEKLKNYDAYFAKLIKKAKFKNRVLKYVACMQNGKATAKLKKMTSANPIAHITDMDNIFVIYSERYKKRPFIIWGAGAGATVTSSGVLRDILAI